jgi:hypothetical protein
MFKLNWNERRELTDSLKAVRIDSSWDHDLNEEEPHAESAATIERAIEAINNLANRVDSQELLLNNYKAVLRDCLTR